MRRLSIVIPVFNEATTIREVINRVWKAPLPDEVTRELVIVDDFSTDGTREILLDLAKSEACKIFFHDRNQGKGAALRTAFNHTTGDIVLIQDADLEYDPQEYPKLLAPILAGKADVVYGSRFLGGEAKRVLFFWHYVGNKFLTILSNMLTNLNLTDMETCYKAFRKEVLSKIRIEEDRFGFEPEITAKIARLKVRIYEVGISYFGRTYTEGKKINWKDGIQAMQCIFKYWALRRKAGIVFLVLFVLVTNILLLERATHEFPKDISNHKMTRYERRFDDLKKDLLGKKIVGYFAGGEIDSFEWVGNYYRTQYALAPIVVSREVNRDLVVGNFSKLGEAPQVVEQKKLYLLKDYGNGLVLYRGKEG